MPYSHVGSKANVGAYCVTADAHRKPGKVHAMNPKPGTVRTYVALCGTIVHEESDDHFMQADPQVVPAAPGHRITCKRCRKIIANP